MKHIYLKLLQKWKSGISFRNQVFLLILALLTLLFVIMGFNFHSALVDTLEDQVGKRAIVQAKEIASDPELTIAVKEQDFQTIELLMKRLRRLTDASFIVVGDANGIRLDHPDKSKIGLPMQGGDNVGALKRGESYISIREGSLGFSVRGKTPIIDTDGHIVGVISVGYLLERLDKWLFFYAKPLVVDFLGVLLLTLICAWLFARHIKNKMNGMEPSEIALALYLQRSILKSVYEGVIAINTKGEILAVNDSGRAMLGTERPAAELKNRSIIEFIDHSYFFFQTPYETNLKDEVVSLNGVSMIANRVAMYDHEELIGWVVSLRKKEDIHLLTAELTQIKQYTDNLRVLRHEHANKLSMISGLIEIGHYDAAQELISSETHRKQKLIDFISARIKSKQVAGILLGKYMRSRELGLELRFDPTCQLDNLTENIDPHELSAIIGNLIDNAFEATLKNPDSSKVIELLITDAGHELVIEISDNGCGIAPEIAENLFTRGVTSKTQSEGHGIGLYLINRYVTNAGGIITIDDAEPQGTIFSIFIPNSGNDLNGS
jgi:two-component system cit operon sensor histidine kinase CitA